MRRTGYASLNPREGAVNNYPIPNTIIQTRIQIPTLLIHFEFTDKNISHRMQPFGPGFHLTFK
ncbi:hypothetical protein [Mucilaginibacter pineti]|uniref:hypothetical protein n=1 Tax=Mucilaginibacter pineti TaxID=1391627 RepID=UPI000B80B305|nr:hypothetical protein [Mucilaginibacter pineti]